MKTFKNYTHTPIIETTSSYIPYKTYCDLLDYIGENYYNLNEETLVEDWWSDLSPAEQSEYIRDHPNSKKAKTAREKEDGDKDKKPSVKDKVKGLFSKEKTAAALKDLKTHVGDVSKSVGVDAKVVAKAFKEPSVYNTINALGGSLSAASKTIIGGARTIGKVLDVGGGVISDTKSFKKLEKGVMKVDEFMDKNPKLKKLSGAAVAGIAAYQWLNMSFSGDIESDYDVSLIADGIAGKAGFADLINTPAGVKSMALLGAGLATGGLPIWMAGKAGLGLALAYTGAKKSGDTETGKKIKEKMVAFGKKAKEKVQKGAKAVDKKLGVKSEEHQMKNFLEFSDLQEKKVDIAQRRKQARRMRVLARSAAFKMRKKRSLMRVRDTAKIAKVARKKTIQRFRFKLYPNYNDLAISAKVKADQRVMQRYGRRIDKISKKLAMKLKRAEPERVKKFRAAQREEE